MESTKKRTYGILPHQLCMTSSGKNPSGMGGGASPLVQIAGLEVSGFLFLHTTKSRLSKRLILTPAYRGLNSLFGRAFRNFHLLHANQVYWFRPTWLLREDGCHKRKRRWKNIRLKICNMQTHLMQTHLMLPTHCTTNDSSHKASPSPKSSLLKHRQIAAIFNFKVAFH